MKIERMMLPRRGTGWGEGYRVSTDLVEALNLPGPSDANKDHDAAARAFEGKRNDTEWAGGIPSLPEFRRFYETGWKEGVNMIREAIGELPVPRIPSIRRRGCWGDEGDEIELSRIYSGELDRAWRTTRRMPDLLGRTQMVRLIIAVDANCMVEPKDLFWRPAIGVAIADALEDAGYRTEIWSACPIGARGLEKRDEPYALLVKMKDLEEPLDLERMAVMAHGGWLRVVGFAVALQIPERLTSTLGVALTGTEEQYRGLFTEEEGEGVKTIVVPGFILTREAALAWTRGFVESSDAE